MLVITAERSPYDTGTALSEAPAGCESAIVFIGDIAKDGHWKPDPVHHVMIVLKLELKAHV